MFAPQNAEALDPRGRTLLHLAVSLGHLESARVLLRHKADVTKENGQGWTGEYTHHLYVHSSDWLKAMSLSGDLPQSAAPLRQGAGVTRGSQDAGALSLTLSRG